MGDRGSGVRGRGRKAFLDAYRGLREGRLRCFEAWETKRLRGSRSASLPTLPHPRRAGLGTAAACPGRRGAAEGRLAFPRGLGPTESRSSVLGPLVSLLCLQGACLPGLLGAIGADSLAQTPQTAFESLGRKLSGYHHSPQICPWRVELGSCLAYWCAGL